MHARVSRGRRRNIDSLGADIADAVACLLLVLAVPLTALGVVGLFREAAPAVPTAAAAVVAVVIAVGAEVALGRCGAGDVDERTVRGGWGSSMARAGTSWS